MASGRDSSLGGDCGYRVRQKFGWRLWLWGERSLGGDCGYRERPTFGWRLAIGKDSSLGGRLWLWGETVVWVETVAMG